jgi:tRNA(fMet)-specific endonuclease VapC
MIVLDTDHLTELQRENSVKGARLLERLDSQADQDATTTVITLEEQLRGRLSAIHGSKDAAAQVPAYDLLTRLLDYYSRLVVLPFDRNAVQLFESLKRQKIRIGTMDLKIAAIVLSRGATLLSANLRDFQQVPGLQVEDWLRP